MQGNEIDLDTVRSEVRDELLRYILAMRRDYQTMPHREFPVKWPDWRQYADILPTTCECKDCRLWRSGS